MDAGLFEYELPLSCIAQVPAQQRDASRLLVVERAEGRVSHHFFKELPDLLPPGSRIFRNDAAVFKARLRAVRTGGGAVECIMLRPAGSARQWWCLLKPGSKLRPGSVFRQPGEFDASVIEKNSSGEYLVNFLLRNDESVTELAERIGEMPLPPYIKRNTEDERKEFDVERYQTLYADHAKKVAVAAPTAGLHFTTAVLNELVKRGFQTYDLTLHVGPGTFQPIKTKAIESHIMHGELYEIPSPTCAALRRAESGLRVAVGTTTVRATEDFFRKIAGGNKESIPQAAQQQTFRSRAELFIYPPATFDAADILLTNFHLPRSTLLCLVSAFLAPGETSGIKWLKEIYREAISMRYKFYSYGDAMLIL